MNKYHVKKVETRREMNDFVRLPRTLYAHCPQYVPDMESSVRAMFNPKTNPGLETTLLQPFVAYDERNHCVGRITAIINYKANQTWNTKSVRFGLIDFIDDKEVSTALLCAVEQWGRERGMTKIEGPLGITDFDKEGMLIEDFDQIGSMNAIYNYAYYPVHMEHLGYQKEVDWVQVQVDIPQEIPPRFERVGKLVEQMYHVHVHKMTRHDLKHGYGYKVFDLLNKAYRPLFGFSQLSPKQVDFFVKEYMPLVDLRMVPVIEDNNGRMLGVAITMGSLSNALQKSKGRLFPLGWLHLLKALKYKHSDKVEMLLIAIDPEFQGMGLNALFFTDLIPVYNKLHYKWAETGPQLEDNVKELSQWKLLHPTIVKRRRCYYKNLVERENNTI